MVFGLGLLFAEAVAAQTVKVDGELRTRSEFRSGFKAPLADSVPSTLVTAARTRLNLSYASEKVNAKITLQDTHFYGSTNVNVAAPGSASSNSFGVYEAWGSYAIDKDLSVTIGRQALEYDDKRLFSASNWSNTGNAHDLALLKYETKAVKAHLGTAYNNSGDDLTQTPYTASPYKYMAFVWLGKSFGKVNATALWVNNGFQRGTTTNLLNKLIIRNTLGGNLEYKDKNVPLYAYLTGYYQFGHDAANKSLNAYLLAVKLKGDLTKTLAVNLGADYLSGSKYDIAKSESHTFNKLFGSNHSFNGSMEYWTTLPASGLTDMYGGLTYTPSKKFNIDVVFHAFSLAQQYSAAKPKKGLGSELDITANYVVSPIFNIQGGWSSYFASDLTKTVKKLSGNTKSSWAYIMLSFKPKFL
ncbi:MAG: hypothetical protein BGN96_02900 [Bacteroidales bacterium 45-6]|nr:MAG: hypothetical protein BGN96_02900 [Bacteroidales bacterium 45-6]